MTAHVRAGSSSPKAKTRVSSVPPVIESAVTEGAFSVEKFVESFEVLVEAAGSIGQLRALAMQVAVRGNLTSRMEHDGSAVNLLTQLRRHRTKLLTTKSIRGAAVLPVQDEEFLFAIPQTWTWTRFGEIGDWGAGATPSRSDSSYYGGTIPWLKSGELNDGYVSTSEETVTQKALKECSLRLNKPGDVLIAMYGATIGRTAILEIEATTNQAVCACTCFPGVLKEYVLLLVRAFRNVFIGQGAGGAQPNISKEKIVATPMPLAPLAEQKRIVARVDQLMALIDDLEQKQIRKRQLGANFTKASLDALTGAESPEEFDTAWRRVVENWGVVVDRAEKVDELRRAVLDLAVRGSLVQSKRGRATNQNSSEEAIAALPFALPEGWSCSFLGDAVEARLGKMLDKVKNRGKPYQYLRNTNVHWFRFELGDIKQMLFSEKDIEEFALRAGDVMVCEGGHGIARTAVWDGQLTPMMFQKALHRLRPLEGLESHFLAYQLRVADQSGHLPQYFTGAGIPHLTGQSLAKFPVVIPPLAEQKRIVAKVDHLMKLCDELEAKLRRAEDRASRLVEAVVGEMVG